MSEDRSNALAPGGMASLLDQMPKGRLGPQGAARDQLQGLANNMPDQPSGPTDLHRMHDYNKATYTKLTESDNMLRHIREELDKLTEMADTVTPQDVIGAAGRLVGHGIPAREMATLLSDMPLGAGQGLASWLQMHDASVRQQETHVEQTMRIAGHRMAVSAMRVLAANAVRDHAGGVTARAGALTPGRTPQAAGALPIAQPQVMQMAQAPGQEGPGAEEAV